MFWWITAAVVAVPTAVLLQQIPLHSYGYNNCSSTNNCSSNNCCSNNSGLCSSETCTTVSSHLNIYCWTHTDAAGTTNNTDRSVCNSIISVCEWKGHFLLTYSSDVGVGNNNCKGVRALAPFSLNSKSSSSNSVNSLINFACDCADASNCSTSDTNNSNTHIVVSPTDRTVTVANCGRHSDSEGTEPRHRMSISIGYDTVNSFLSLGSSVNYAETVNELPDTIVNSVELVKGKKLVLDLDLFVPTAPHIQCDSTSSRAYPLHQKPVNNNLAEIQNVQKLLICDKLKALYKSDGSFTFVSEHPLKYSDWSLLYWLQLCKIENAIGYSSFANPSITLHSRSSDSSTSAKGGFDGTGTVVSDTDMGLVTSYCILRKVAPRSNRLNSKLPRGGCVEDLMNGLMAEIADRNADDASISFVSSLNFDLQFHKYFRIYSSESNRKAHYGLLAYHDFLAVVSAFKDSLAKSLIVKSSATVFQSLMASRLEDDLDDDTHSCNSFVGNTTNWFYNGNQSFSLGIHKDNSTVGNCNQNPIGLKKALLDVLLLYDSDQDSFAIFQGMLIAIDCSLSVPLHRIASQKGSMLSGRESVPSNVMIFQLTSFCREVLQVIHKLLITKEGTIKLKCISSYNHNSSTPSYLCRNLEQFTRLIALLNGYFRHLEDTISSKTMEILLLRDCCLSYDNCNTLDVGSVNGIGTLLAVVRNILKSLAIVKTAIDGRLSIVTTSEGSSSMKRDFLSNSKHSADNNISNRSKVSNAVGGPKVDVLCEGDVFVFIFVIPEHAILAQKMVEYWTQSCEVKVCQLFIKYLIVPIATSSGQPCEGQFDVGCRSCYLCYLNAAPSMRSALLAGKDLINDIVTKKDIVTVLLGLQALFSFPQPSAPNSFIPPIEYGELKSFLLPSEIVVASTDYLAQDSDSIDARRGYDSVNTNAIVGLGGELESLITAVLEESPAAVSDEEVKLNFYLLLMNNSKVKIDQRQTVFSSEVGKQIMHLLSRTLFTSRRVNVQVDCFGSEVSCVTDKILEWCHNRFGTITGGLKDSSTCDGSVDVDGDANMVVDLPTTLIDTLTCNLYSKELLKNHQFCSNLSDQLYEGSASNYTQLLQIVDLLEMDILLNEKAAADYEKSEIVGKRIRSFIDDCRFLISADGNCGSNYCCSKTDSASLSSCRAFNAYILPNQELFPGLQGIVTHINDTEYSINFDVFADAIGATSDLMRRAKWFATVATLLRIVETTKFAVDYSLYEDSIYNNIIELAKLSKMWNYMISSEEFSATADILEFYLYQLDQSSFNQNYVGDISYLQHLYDSTNVGLSNYREDAASMTGYLDKDKLQLTIGVLLSCLYLQIGNHNRMQFSMQRSLLRLPYSVINDEGLLWQKQKEIMQLHIDKEMSLPYRFGWHGVTVHYVTYASEETKELKNLLYSAAIAGVDVKVLGLGDAYRDYSDKLRNYFDYLHYSTISESENIIADDDIVLLMDGYDVLLLPAITNLPKMLARSKTPIVFCSENGIYPEFSSAFFYPDETSPEAKVRHEHKFLNSGCIVGRAGQMRAMLAYANRYNNIFRDDQQIFVRYMLQNPHLVSISRLSATDDDSRDQKIHSEESLFLSLFKEATSDNSSQLTVTLDLKFIYQATSSIGLLHFNNRKSSNMYDVIVESLQIIISTCYSGSDGISLLQAVYAIRDGRYDIALLILTTDVVRNNMKSYGGTNTLGDYLLERVTQLQASVRKQNEQLSERS